MATQRSISLDIPKCLLDQIEQRARINQRSRNAEIRWLVDLALRYCRCDEVVVELPTRRDGKWVQTISRLHLEAFAEVNSRACGFHRGVGMEIVRLVTYAIEETARRDLAVITDMVKRSGSPGPTAPQTAST